MPLGFILQSTYRTEAGRPVVLIYGSLQSGGSFLIRDTRQTPCFYVRRSDLDRARKLGAPVVERAEPRRTLSKEPAVRVELRTPQEMAALRARLEAAAIPTFEADIRFANRYLIDRGIRGTLEIDGESRASDGIDAVFDNPEVRPASWDPQLSVLSLDIETDPRASRVLSVALHGCGAQEVLLLTPPGYSCPASATPFATERELLQAFVRRVRELDPDVLTGWNVVDFDLAVLARIGGRVGVPLPLGRGAEPLRIVRSSLPRGSSRAYLPGRVVLDGIDLLRGAFVKVERYGLDAVARQLLGRGKTKTMGGSDRADAILRSFEQEREQFVEYNLNDALLVLEILDFLHLVPLTVERSRLTGMPPDRVGASIASFDFLYLSELGRRNIVAPSVAAQRDADVEGTGGHVLEPRPGLYRHVLVFDFKSLYPSIIRTFQIDPLGYLPDPTPADDAIVAPNGAAFRREPGILPRMLDDLFPRREAAKQSGDAVASQAIKILMNSFYGVLGTSACRFASPALANAITGFGREILLWSKGRIEAHGREVLYGDTDSLFVRFDVEDDAEAARLGEALVETLNRELAAHIRDVWQVESALQLEFEKLYHRLLLPAVRHGTAGARKRYAGLVTRDGEKRVEFTGLEVVRRDWTRLAKRVQRELYERLFSDREVHGYLRETVRELRAGRLDELLVYRKALRKRLEDYTASTPPHVAAARKSKSKPGRSISYLITLQGPEPADEVASPIDHEHYVQKQLRPVAEPVLTLLGLDFNRVIGDEAQLELF